LKPFIKNVFKVPQTLIKTDPNQFLPPGLSVFQYFNKTKETRTEIFIKTQSERFL